MIISSRFSRTIGHRKNQLFLAIFAILACLWLANGPLPARADSPLMHTTLLVPVGGPGFVQLAAGVFKTDLQCDEGGCAIRVEQSYRLHNRDRAQEAALRLRLPTNSIAFADAPVLKDVRGVPLVPIEGADPDALVWEIKLGRDQQQTFTLTYSHPHGSGPFVQWDLDLPQLAAWGTVEGVRVRFGLPHYLPEKAFLRVDPGNYQVDTGSLIWDYEQLQDPPPTQVWMYAPTAWDKLESLRANNAHRDLASFYAELEQAATQAGIPWPDPFDQIAAELQAAAQADPGQTAPLLDLAQLYQRRADARPDLRLNYLILSAQELAQALAIQPENSNLAGQLSQTYYEAANLASAAGDPAGALLYLKKAAEVPGAQLDEIIQAKEELTLRWAVELAGQGQVSKALDSLAGMVPAQVTDTIIHYAPPFTSLQTEVTLSPAGRVARYSLALYPPVAEQTLARLQEIVGQITASTDISATLQQGQGRAILELIVSGSPEVQRQQAAALRNALSQGADFLTTNVLAPWQTTPETYEVAEGLWYNQYHYREQVGTDTLQSALDNQAQYISWRTVEMRTAQIGSEREQLEQRLALVALQEQRAVWEQLSAGSYTVYRVDYAPAPGAPQDMRWLVPWGRSSTLAFAHTVYHWDTILPTTGGMILLALLTLFFSAHLRRPQ